MATQVDWNSMGGEKKNTRKTINFLKFEAGKGKTFRPVGKAVQFVKFFVTGKHIVVDSELKDQAAAVISAETGQDVNGKVRYAINVIDREDNQIKVLEGGPQIFKHFANWSKGNGNVNPGGINAMDWMIMPTGEKLQREYTTTPIRQSTLTNDEIDRCKNKKELYSLGEIYKSIPINEIANRLHGKSSEEQQPVMAGADVVSASDDAASW